MNIIHANTILHAVEQRGSGGSVVVQSLNILIMVMNLIGILSFHCFL